MLSRVICQVRFNPDAADDGTKDGSSSEVRGMKLLDAVIVFTCILLAIAMVLCIIYLCFCGQGEHKCHFKTYKATMYTPVRKPERVQARRDSLGLSTSRRGSRVTFNQQVSIVFSSTSEIASSSGSCSCSSLECESIVSRGSDISTESGGAKVAHGVIRAFVRRQSNVEESDSDSTGLPPLEEESSSDNDA